MTFDDLAATFDPTLRLTIGGKVYRVPPPSAAVGLQLQALQALALLARTGAPMRASDRARLALDDDDELDLVVKSLGSAYQDLVDDGVPYPYLVHAGVTAYLYWTVGPEKAETFWRSHQGEAQRPPFGGPGSPAPVTVAASTRTAAGSGTRTPRPGSGTSARKGGRRSPNRARSVPDGTSSSTPGPSS